MQSLVSGKLEQICVIVKSICNKPGGYSVKKFVVNLAWHIKGRLPWAICKNDTQWEERNNEQNLSSINKVFTSSAHA